MIIIIHCAVCMGLGSDGNYCDCDCPCRRVVVNHEQLSMRMRASSSRGETLTGQGRCTACKVQRAAGVRGMDAPQTIYTTFPQQQRALLRRE